MQYLPITDDDVLQVMLGIVKYPRAQVCKHWAALELFKLFEKAEYGFDPRLSQALIDSDDEQFEKLIEEIT